MLALTVSRVLDNSKMFQEKIFANHTLSAKYAKRFLLQQFFAIQYILSTSTLRMLLPTSTPGIRYQPLHRRSDTNLSQEPNTKLSPTNLMLTPSPEI